MPTGTLRSIAPAASRSVRSRSTSPTQTSLVDGDVERTGRRRPCRAPARCPCRRGPRRRRRCSPPTARPRRHRDRCRARAARTATTRPACRSDSPSVSSRRPVSTHSWPSATPSSPWCVRLADGDAPRAPPGWPASMRATPVPEHAQIEPSPAPSPWHSSPPTSTSTVSTIAFVAGAINTTEPLSSLAHTPCSSASSQSGPPSTSIAAIRPSVGSGSVVATATVVDDDGRRGGCGRGRRRRRRRSVGVVRSTRRRRHRRRIPAASMPTHAEHPHQPNRPLTRRTVTADVTGRGRRHARIGPW